MCFESLSDHLAVAARETGERQTPVLLFVGGNVHNHLWTPPMAANTDGTIKRLTDKGFGFIAAADGTEYFFHQSAIQGARYDELREGQRVTFSIGQGPKGPRAENVRPA